MSDEIPVGSPPAPPGRHAAPGGWYADPAKPGQERYWDGWQWTRNVRGAAGPQPGPQGFPEYPQGPGQNYGQPLGGNQNYGAGQNYGQPDQGQQQPGQYQQGQYQQAPHQPSQYQGYPQQYGQYPGQPAYAPAGFRPVPATADGVPLAGWWWRVLAFIIDSFLISMLIQLVSAVTPLGAAVTQSMNEYMAYLQETMTTGSQIDLGHVFAILYPPAQVILSVISLVAAVVYGALMTKSRGSTLGMMACGLRVVPFGRGQTPKGLPAPTAWGRAVIAQAMGQIPVLNLVNWLFPLGDRNRQTLHDKIAKTQVVKER